jgi:hypothetical protein
MSDIKQKVLRRCTKCGEEKSLDLFTNNKGCEHGKTHVCKECTSIWQKEHRKLKIPPIPIIVQSKSCKKCGNIKDIDMFHKKKQNKDGHSNICKSCQSIYIRDYKNTDNGWSAYQKGRANYYLKHKQKYIDYRGTEQYREYRGSKEYKEMCCKTHRIYVNKRRREDHVFKIEQNLRIAVRTRLKKQNVDAKVLDLIGCSYAQFKTYIEGLFKEGMSWDNWTLRGWHLDHIIPCASFNLADPVQQKQCFHYSNLQPLWWYDNLAKGAKVVA